MSYPINSFNPPPQAVTAFNQMFGQPEISPIGGYAGNSHFGHVKPLNIEAQNPGWHISTEIPGLKQGCPVVHRDFLSDMGF